jgi:type IV secretion system protein VirD4
MNRLGTVALWCVLAAALATGCMFLASKLFVALLFKSQQAPVDVMPWTIIEYYQQLGHIKKVRGLIIFSSIVPTLAVAAVIALVFWPKRPSLFGEARWAKRNEIHQRGMLNGDGLIVGQLPDGTLVTSKKGEHVSLIAPTGGGKGVAFILPNLLTFDGSAIVTDIKFENFRYTSKFRAMHGHEVFLFNPTSFDTHGWNPFHYIGDTFDEKITGLNSIASILWPDENDKGEPWGPSARMLFRGLALREVERGYDLTPGNIAYLGNTLDAEALKTEIQDKQAAGAPYAPETVAALTDYINTPDKMQGSIRKTFTSRMDLFSDPYTDAATSKNDFDFRQLRRKRMTIYIGVAPRDIDRMAPLINLFIQQAIRMNTDVEQKSDKTLAYPLAMFLDEQAALGKLDIVINAIAYLRSYNLWLASVYQSQSQMRDIYGVEKAKTYIENHTVRIIYTPNSMEVAGEISKELGNTTSYSKGKSGELWETKSHSQNEASRALMLDQEVMRMPDNDAIILARGLHPIKLNKLKYFNSAALMDRLKTVSPQLAAAAGKKLPTQTQLEDAFERGDFAIALPRLEKITRSPPPSPIDKRPFVAIELNDLAVLESRPLHDFNLDFSQAPQPKANMTPDEVTEYADRMFFQLTGIDPNDMDE